MAFEQKILMYLVENYRKSTKDRGNQKINRRTQTTPDKFYKKYYANDGDIFEIGGLNESIEQLVRKGFVTTENELFGTQIKKIYLVDERILEVENYLSDRYNYVSKEMQLQVLQQLVDKYANASPLCAQQCDLIRNYIRNRKVPKNYLELENVLKAISFIENNQHDLYIREVSMKVYGDSKFFEQTTLQPVCQLLRKQTGKDIAENELMDEVLHQYHIYKEPQKLCMKGNVVLTLSNKQFNVSLFQDGIEIMASDLKNIQSVEILAEQFMTIENRTSYLRYQDANTVSFYLGGYANRFQRDFIQLIYKTNPHIQYKHFGDIDAGGFWIHSNLCDFTGIDFDLFSMSRIELEDEQYSDCLLPLTENDKNRLMELKSNPLYSDTVTYMLNHEIKLEQEIVSLNLMNS